MSLDLAVLKTNQNSTKEPAIASFFSVVVLSNRGVETFDCTQ